MTLVCSGSFHWQTKYRRGIRDDVFSHIARTWDIWAEGSGLIYIIIISNHHFYYSSCAKSAFLIISWTGSILAKQPSRTLM